MTSDVLDALHISICSQWSKHSLMVDPGHGKGYTDANGGCRLAKVWQAGGWFGLPSWWHSSGSTYDWVSSLNIRSLQVGKLQKYAAKGGPEFFFIVNIQVRGHTPTTKSVYMPFVGKRNQLVVQWRNRFQDRQRTALCFITWWALQLKSILC